MDKLTKKEKDAIKRKRFYEKHRELVLERNKKWREENKNKYLNTCRKYRETHKEFYKDYMKNYRVEHKSDIREKRIARDFEKDYISIHNKTAKKVRELWIRPTVCPICNKEKRVYTHHPNYDKWNEVVFCCQSCHWMIHSWAIECPKPINLLDYNE